MHGAAQSFGRARAIDADKSVSLFLKQPGRVRFKISFQKVLKLKKNLLRPSDFQM